MSFLSSRLNDEHVVDDFDCGKEVLDHWLKTQARRAQQSDSARTYVWTRDGSPQVLAYYSLTPTQVVRAELTSGQAGGLSVVPAFLLARLALDRSLQGQQLGGELLMDALEVIVKASHVSAGRLIVVDAIDDAAASFYRRHDFQPVKDNPRRLVMKVATARSALGLMTYKGKGDRATRLVSLTFTMPDGSVVPIVVSREEAERVAHRLIELARSKERDPNVSISLADVFQEVLGHNPFVQS